MKRIYTLLTFLLFAAFSAQSQTFWTENFGSSSTAITGTPVNVYSGTGGPWALTILGTEGANPNIWYVSCTEGGKAAGTCGAICASGDMGPTLHIGSHPGVAGDLGAAYFTGGCTIYTTYWGSSTTYGVCAATDRRAESPVINCTGKYGITLSYYYIENGQSTQDDGSVWYNTGTGWTLLENPPKTTVCVGGQGQWAHRTIALPSSADNNPNVKIGFRWVNDEDGVGTDPSFAIDSVSLSALAVPVASFTTSRDTICQDSCIVITNTSTSAGTIDSFRWSIVGLPVVIPSTTPSYTLCLTSTIPAGTYTLRLDVFGGGSFDSATRVIVVKATPRPVITKLGHVLSVPTAYLSYQWYNGPTAISGATNPSYTYTILSGSYKVVVDSGGCKGVSAIINTVGVNTVNLVDNKFWTAQNANNILSVYIDQVINEDLNITLSDQAGRQLISETWPQGTDSKQVNSVDLPPGMYLIRISNAKTSTVLKWMKQ